MLPRFEDLDPETAALVESLMPASALEMVRLIGLQATLLVIENFGGMEMCFLSDADNHRSLNFYQLGDVIGTEKATVLARQYPSVEKLYIPRGEKIMRALRDREIKLSYQQVIRDKRCRVACNDLAKKYRLSARSIQQIVNGKRKST